LGPVFNEKVVGGWDFVNNDDDPMDDQGHGTHVAATAAGNGVLKGVAPDAKIVAYKVLGSNGAGSWESVISAIERSVDSNQDGDFSDKLDVISLSLGGPGNPGDPVSQAIDNVVDEGVVAVVAAGNSGYFGENTIKSPGTARKAITVGAVDKQDQIAWFSSRGPVIWEDEHGKEKVLIKPDVVAPGVDICAAQSSNKPWNDYLCFDNNHVAISDFNGNTSCFWCCCFIKTKKSKLEP
jgi:subtilisin family serine protease